MSEAIIVTLVLTLKPEASETFRANVSAMLDDTREHPGFRGARVLRHEADPNKINIIEEWDSLQDQQNYIMWRTERGDMAALGDALSAAPEINIWALNAIAEAQA